MKKNSIHAIEIVELNEAGQGVGRLEDMSVLVDGVLPGEKLDVKLIKVAGHYAIGKPLHITSTSQDRVQPFCEVFTRCGGCSLQHLNYEAQLAFKTAIVKQHIHSIPGCEKTVIHNTIGMQHPLDYRNKAIYPIGLQHGRVLSGFYARHSHDIIEHRVCRVQHDAIGKVVSRVQAFLIDHKIPVYHEARHEGLVRHLMVRVGFRTGEIMVVLVIKGEHFPFKEKLVNSLISKIPAITSIILNINQHDTNSILGQENILLHGNKTLVDTLGSFQFEISPLSFYQVNPVQTDVLYETAVEYAGLTGQETVFDLYSGIGTLSVFLARQAKKVFGVERVTDAVKDAKNNARRNGLTNIEWGQGAVEQVIPELYAQGVKADVVVVDPPRKGCDAELLRTIVTMRPTRIVYISCQPKSLARDLRHLTQAGFEVLHIQPIDMFPHTNHIETVVRLEFPL